MAEVILNNDNFKAEVLDAKGLVLVDFWATWCGRVRCWHQRFLRSRTNMKEKSRSASSMWIRRWILQCLMAWQASRL